MSLALWKVLWLCVYIDITLCHAATHKTVDVWIGSRATCGDIVSCTSCTGDAEVLNVLLV